MPAATRIGWHHIACTWDGVTVRSYLGGALVLTEPFVGTLPNINASLTIGNRAGTAWFVGSMDDIRLYYRILSNEEIKQLYNMGN